MSGGAFESPASKVATPRAEVPRGSAWRRLFFARMTAMRRGELVFRDAMGEKTFGRRDDGCPLRAVLSISDKKFYRRAILSGSLGVAESFMEGEFECDDLAALFRIVIVNESVNRGIEGGASKIASWLHLARHALRKNTRSGARKNITAHYDLGNEFFSLFLDSTLSYSAAIFDDASRSLESAQRAKSSAICEKLALNASDHLVEIGTGWGGLAVFAAENYGCRVTTTTISRRQFEYAKALVRDRGLENRVTVLDRDYRELEGRFDKLVSIEMIEAVGSQYFDLFFKTCSRLLSPEGLMLIQAITIADREYERARREVDFIKEYVFPGCCIPSLAALSQAAAKTDVLEIVDIEDIGPHYAETLRRWAKRYRGRADDVRALGFEERFLRLWEYYFAYCEAGFDERYLRDLQILWAAPDNRRPAVERRDSSRVAR